ncbi:translocation/assembly module TamB domain-containing protein [Primorskyibacter aestuariivivens]|uniref:translocation/assembly module TamB domain-containing protein n=1 Tax=Primorskyibacter aestuariivivens TaxID=1888912 RepID=UPI002300B07C|nr:translocation/assembly module TamB domain-containing protein [Primorskyibacter aestuariivivens]MDA7430947.1 translocation/assembly module TamB domain-containing protein [Primorskyibacter aestuariivivens]
MRLFPALLLAVMLWPIHLVAQSAEDDRGYIQGLLEDNLSGPGQTVRLEGFEGALSSRATVDKITIADDAGTWLSMSDVALTWSRSALLRGAVEIDEISVKRIDIPRPPNSSSDDDTDLPAPEASGPFMLPELPVSLRLAKLDLARVRLGKAFLGETVELAITGSAELVAGSGTADLEIKRLDRAGALTLEGAFRNYTRDLELSLDLREPQSGIAARLLSLPGAPSVALIVQGEGPLDDFAATLDLSTDGQTRLAGQLDLTGTDGNGTRFEADLGGDIAPLVAPDYRAFLGSDVRLSARGARSGEGVLELERLRVVAAALELEGNAVLQADYWPETVSLSGAITPSEGDRVILPLPGEPVSIRSADLTVSFDAAQSDLWTLTTRLRAPERGDDAAERVELTGRGTLSPEQDAMSGTVGFAATGLRLSDAALSRAVGTSIEGGFDGQWQRGTPVELRNLSLAGADFGLSGTMSIRGLDGAFDLVLRPDIKLRAEDLGRFSGLAGVALEGAADLTVAGQISPLSQMFDVKLSGETRDLGSGIPRLDPLIGGRGTLSAAILRDQSGLRLSPLRIATEQARIEATGDLKTGASRVVAEVEVFDLALVDPGLRGNGRVTLDATQTGDQWQVSADGTLPGETNATYRGTVQSGDQGALTLAGRGTVEVGQLAVFSGLLGQPLSGGARFDATGSTDLSDQSFSIEATGQTRSLTVGITTLDPLLSGTVDMALSASGDATGRVSLSEATVNGPGLAANLAGTIAPSGASDLQYRVSLPDLNRVVSDLSGPATLQGTAHREDGGAWRVSAQGQGPGGLTLTTDGTVAADGQRLDLVARGNAPLSLANPYLSGQSLTGRVGFDLAVNGPPALSSLRGRLQSADGRLFIPDRGLSLSPLRGEVVLTNGAATVALTGDLSSGGRLRLTGPVQLNPPYSSDLVAQLTDVTIREDDFLTAALDGRLTLRGPLTGRARIAGDILVSRLDMRIPDIGPSYAALDGLKHQDLPPDVRRTLEYADLLGHAQTQASSTAVFPIDITVQAPSRLFIRGRGLDAEMGGRLRLTGTTANVVPQGQFDLIRGRLDLLGRRLTLTRGALSLRGSFDPVIDFAATSMVEGTDISLGLAGVASAPDLTVTASPDLPQDEALSLFLFGRDPTQISALQAVQLAAAIRTLSGRGGLGLSERLRQGLGVDNLDVGTDAEGNSQAQIGKYISDRIYTDVTLSSTGNREIRLNIDVSPNVTVRGRASSEGETGIGVFFERDY